MDGATASGKVGMYAKPQGDYAALPLIAVEAVGNPATLTPQTNTERINTALGVGTEGELDCLKMMCEIVYCEGGLQVATVTLALVLHNNVARPGLPGDQLQDDPYSGGDADLATISNPGIVMPDGKSILVDAAGKISVPSGSKATPGILSVGDNINLADGAISIPTATNSTMGVSRPDNATIKVDGYGKIYTESIRSIGGHNSCHVELGSGLSVTIVDSERIKIDVEQSGGGVDGQGYFARVDESSYESDCELTEGVYVVDIAMSSSIDSRYMEFLFGGTVEAGRFVAGRWYNAGGQSGDIMSNGFLVGSPVDGGGLLYIQACVCASSSSRGTLSIRSTADGAPCAIGDLQGTYRRLGGLI